MSRRRDARRVALDALGEVLDGQRGLGDVEAFARLEDAREQAFARRLAYGVLRWKGALDWLADALLERPLRAKERQVRRLVLLGLYQLWREDTADHAAVHATANVARSLGKPWAVGLVNAVLRNFQRRREDLLADLATRPERHAHPDWLVSQLRADWPSDWERILEENNRPAPLWLRCNRRQGTRDAARTQLESAGFTVSTHPHAPDALAISPAAPVSDIPGFASGRFSVQDPAAQLAVALVEAEPGQRVLDACAAPGGKTGHLLEQCPDIELTALDRSPSRLERVRENLQRLDLEATLVAADAADTDAWWDGRPFDRILLDAPCSATGVIRRHPEIKWLRTPDQVNEVQQVQSRLLERLWPLLRHGGILVYATCSVLRRENNETIQAFLAAHDDATCTGPTRFGHAVGPGRQLRPGDDRGDGFYYAVLRRSGP